MKCTLKTCSIETFVFDHFRLDGGAMFGSIPKNLWAKAITPDAENCIPLATRSLLITSEKRKVLVDVGMGDFWTDKQRKIFSIQACDTTARPFRKEEITDIILTHLHFDHAGGLCCSDGKAQFPNASLYIQSDNFETALNPNARERASYLSNVVTTVEQSSSTQLNGNVELFDGISVHVANGHTKGLQWLTIRDGSTTVAFPSDLIPTAHHVSLPYCMGYDMCVETTLREKAAFLERAVAENWLVVFQHDRDTAAATILKDAQGRFVIDKPLSD